MADDDFDLDGALDNALADMQQNANVTDDDDDDDDDTDNDDNNNNVNNNNNNNNIPSTTDNLTNSNPKTSNNDKDDDDDAIMQDALNAVQQSINNANDAQSNNDMMNDDEMKDFFNEIFKSFSNLDDNADDDQLDAALKKVMTQFFDANQLKEPVSIIVSKYPAWLDENKSKLSTKDYDNYEKQYKLYNEANTLLSSSNPDTNKIMDILLKTFAYGSLPAAVMDGMMPDELKQFADQMAQFEKTVDNDNNDDNSNSNVDQKDNNDNNSNSNNANNSNNASGNDDMNADEAMKFFQQLMSMQGGGGAPNNNNNDNNDNNSNANNANGDNFMPNLNDLPKLSADEMKQFKQLMNQDGCIMM